MIQMPPAILNFVMPEKSVITQVVTMFHLFVIELVEPPIKVVKLLKLRVLFHLILIIDMPQQEKRRPRVVVMLVSAVVEVQMVLQPQVLVFYKLIFPMIKFLI